MPTNPTPAARLAAALETYWPEGCPMFMKPEDEYYYTLPHQSWRVMNSITLHSEPRFNIMIIAAVAAVWWRKVKHDLECANHSYAKYEQSFDAVSEFQRIYEAATEAEQ